MRQTNGRYVGQSVASARDTASRPLAPLAPIATIARPAPLGDGMRRRDFIALGGAALAAGAVGARAQQPLPRIGLLASTTPNAYASRIEAFRRGLSEAGYVEGRNVAIEQRWAEEKYERLPEMAADLVSRNVSVIVAITTASATAAKAATASVPIVFEVGGDPITLGLVTSLSRPDGNLTGVSLLNVELGTKRLELVHQLVPSVRVVAALVNPSSPNAKVLVREFDNAARDLGLELHILNATSQGEFEQVFATLTQQHVGALVIGTDPLFNDHSERLASLATRNALPTIYQYRAFVTAGGLMSYGGNFEEPFRQTGIYTGRVLKGAKPTDLPIQQSSKVELIVNLKAAKGLGISVPMSLLGRADEIIE